MPRRPMLHLTVLYFCNCYLCSPSIHTKNSMAILGSFLSLKGITRFFDAFIEGLMGEFAELLTRLLKSRGTKTTGEVF